LLPKSAYATTFGIDISNHNEITDYSKLQSSDVKVVIQKATEGESFTDKYLYYRADNIPKIGKSIGYYHFANNSGDPIGQAQHFINAIKGLKSDTVYFLDIENEGSWSKSQAVYFTNEFIHYMQLNGYKMGLYTGEYFYRDYLQNNIPDIPLWLANYSYNLQHIPSSYSLQYSETGFVDGIGGNVDLDYFIDNIYLNNQSVFVNSSNNQPVVQTNNISNVEDKVTKAKKFVGSRCTELQQKLNKVGYSLVVDGNFGQLSYNAVINFQSKNGLVADGLAGTKTFTKLDELINSQNQVSSNSNVLALQKLCNQLSIKGVNGRSLVEDDVSGANTKYAVSKLSTCGLAYKQRLATKYVQSKLGISADGIFGNITAQKVKQYQKQHGLYADGVVGKNTWANFLNN
jgi:lysozyme